MLLLLLSWGLTFAAHVSLDTHVHYQTIGNWNPMTLMARPITPVDTKKHYESVLAQSFLDRFFLLSEAYLEADFEKAKQKNQDIAELTSNEPKAIPVCGLSIKYDFYRKIVKHCLSLNLSGFKMHLANEQVFLEGENLKRLTDAFALLPIDKNYFVLTHYYYTFDQKRNREQTQNLIALSLEFPHVAFIVGHAATGNPKMIEDIATYYEEHPSVVKNIYLETSTLFTSFGSTSEGYKTYYGYSLEYYQKLFERFGIERVLYGSDTFVTNPVNTKEIDFIMAHGFTFYEQDRILVKNGEDFLARLGL